MISSRISPRIPLRMRYALLPVAFRRRVDHHPTDQAPLAGGAPSRFAIPWPDGSRLARGGWPPRGARRCGHRATPTLRNSTWRRERSSSRAIGVNAARVLVARGRTKFVPVPGGSSVRSGQAEDPRIGCAPHLSVGRAVQCAVQLLEPKESGALATSLDPSKAIEQAETLSAIYRALRSHGYLCLPNNGVPDSSTIRR